jgi:hypothetical protein
MRSWDIELSAGLGALAVALIASACSYDFDQFAKQGPGNSGGSPGAETGGADGLGGSANPAGAGGNAGAGGDGAGGNAAVAGAGGDGAGGSVPADAASDAPVDASSAICSVVGGTVYGGHCYYVNTTPSTFDVAATACPSIAGFHLVTITSAGEAAAVTALVSASGKDYWIGLEEPRSSYQQKLETNFFWVDNEPYNPQTSYRNWDPSEPTFVGDCVLLHPTGKWASAKCDTTSLWFICEHD